MAQIKFFANVKPATAFNEQNQIITSDSSNEINHGAGSGGSGLGEGLCRGGKAALCHPGCVAQQRGFDGSAVAANPGWFRNAVWHQPPGAFCVDRSVN